MSTPRVLVILAGGAEEMEVTITVDLLRRAGIEVVLAGLDGPGPVVCSRRLVIVPDAALGDATGPFDAVVLPGGAEGARRLAAAPAVGDLLRERERAGELVAAICAAPIALREHGVFAGRVMTCHPSVREVVDTHASASTDRVVEDGPLITSRGPGTAFEFALALIRRLAGEEEASRVRAPLVLDE
jgi:protein DJ-1